MRESTSNGLFGRLTGNEWRLSREEVYESSLYCILHIDLPDKTNPEFGKIKSAKDRKVLERIDPKNPDFNFEGAKISIIEAPGREDNHDLNFDNATIEFGAWFNNAMLLGDA